MRAQKPSSPALQLSPISLTRMIWKHKLAVALVTFVLSGGACVVVYRLPAIYKSEATILVDEQKIPERYVSSTVNTDVADRLATISQEILSSTALKKIIDNFDLYHSERQHLFFEEIIERMRKDITITTEKGWTGNRPGAFHVGFNGPDPNIVASVANRVANLFVEENLRTREVQADGTSEFIVTELTEAKKKLDELESKVSRYKLEHNGELPEQQNAIIGNLARLQVVLQGDQDAVARAHQTKLLLENSLNIAQGMADAAAGSAPAAGQQPQAPGQPGPDDLSRRITAKEAQLETLRLQFTDNYPDVKALRADIARLRARASDADAKKASAAVPSSGQPGAPQQPQMSPQDEARLAEMKGQLKLINDEIQHRMAEEESVKNQISAIQARLDQLPVREQQMAGVTRDYQISKQNYQSLLEKKLSADMAAEMERRQKAERFTILDPARVPAKPYKPNRPLLYGSSCAVALALALASVIGFELRSDVLLGEWELPPELKVLGRVPVIAVSGDVGGRPRTLFGMRRPQWKLALITSILICLGAAVGAGWLKLRDIV